MSDATAKDLLAQAAAFFAGRSWPSEAIGARLVEVTHGWSGLPFKSRAHVAGGGPIFIYDSHVPERAPLERRDAVARYLTRANLGLLVGAFALDLDDGSVRLRTSVDLRGAALTDELLSGVVYPNHQGMIDHLPYLIAVIRGDQAPDDAYRELGESIG